MCMPLIFVGDLPTDPVMDSIIAKFEQIKQEKYAQVLGTLTVPLDATHIRQQETNIGDFMADTMQAYMAHMLQSMGNPYKTLVLFNGGSVRTSYIDVGSFTLGNLWSLLPFNPSLTAVTLNGTQLLAVLENGVSRVERFDGRFPQIGGFRFAFSSAKPAGSRVTGMWNSDGSAIANSDVFNLVVTDFLLTGGDGYCIIIVNTCIVIPCSSHANKFYRKTLAYS